MLSTTKTAAFAAAVCAALGITAAQAGEAPQTPFAKLAALSGDVLVDQGQALAPAETGMTLKDLDRVMVLAESKATLTFSDGCSEQVVGPAMRTITRGHTCKDVEAVSLGQVTADAAASADALTLQQAATSQGNDDDQLGLIILGVAGTAGFAWGLSNDDPSRSRSRQIRDASPE